MTQRWLVTVVLLWAGVGHAAPEPRRYPLPMAAMRPEQGSCFIASLDCGEEGDKDTANRSGLLVFEDGRPLGPPHALHADIRTKGAGRYSHWTREALYFSASDNTDPRTNGRRYELASTNPESSLGGLAALPTTPHRHVEIITGQEHRYAIALGGTVDAENSRTVSSGNVQIAFQPNLALTIANEGDTPVVAPRLVINGRGNWYTFEDLLAEFTAGATTAQEKAYRIWQSMRENLYHETPLFDDHEPHDPVRLFGIFGFNLCDDAGSAGCSLFHHAGLTGSKVRALNGHVQVEAMVDGRLQFLDIDMDCCYLDRENERPVSGDELARDHDLVRRELNYGPVVSAWQSSDLPAGLFGPDDRLSELKLRGHTLDPTLRPGERVVFRWDNVGKVPSQRPDIRHQPKYFGNSRFEFTPRLTAAAIAQEATAVGVVAAPAGGAARLVGAGPDSHLEYAVRTPYLVCGGTVRAEFVTQRLEDRCAVALSLDGQTWRELWSQAGPGRVTADVSLDDSLDLHRLPAKYGYRVRLTLGSAAGGQGAGLAALTLTTDVLAAPFALPRLRLGRNDLVYTAASAPPAKVVVTHEWQETDAVAPLSPPAAPTSPAPGGVVRQTLVDYAWPPVTGGWRYHLQVSRRPDFAWPYRTSLDVIIPRPAWQVPFAGIYSPDTTYYGRLRVCDRWGVWSAWGPTWTFTWAGPRVPVDVRANVEGPRVTLHWRPNPRGERPVRYEIYGSDEQGFSVSKAPQQVPGRGTVPSNFLGATTDTSLLVAGPDLTAANANRAFYRVVAVDAQGVSSGCSDFAVLPRPFIATAPPLTARVGQPYRYQPLAVRSLGDLQGRPDPAAPTKSYAYRYYDEERLTWALAAGPPWLRLDPTTGELTGTPTAADVGAAAVVLQVKHQFGGQAEQRWDLPVGR